jgi:hypothetical protein
MVRGGVTLLLLLTATATLAAERRPVITLNGDRVLASLPDTILKDARVRTRLESALTTTFILRSSVGGSSRIEIRYDLWDEVYRVRRDRAAQQEIAKAQLESWWQTPIDVGRAGERRTVDIELIVLPFSVAEEKDARQWLSKSGGAGAPPADPSSIVDVLIGTTLTARPIVSFRWSVEIPKR